MSRIKTLLLASIGLAALLADAHSAVPSGGTRIISDWQPMLASAEESWEYDANSIRRERGRVQIWLRVMYAEAQYSANRQPWWAVRAHMVFDCATRRFGERESVVYADLDFRIVAFTFSDPSPELNPASPGSIGAAMLAAVCGR